MSTSLQSILEAIYRNDEERLGRYLTDPANRVLKSPEGETLLHAAADSGHPGMVNLLLKAGLSVHARTAEGETPLHWAARYGRRFNVFWLNPDFRPESPWAQRRDGFANEVIAQGMLTYLRIKYPGLPENLKVGDELPEEMREMVHAIMWKLIAEREHFKAELEVAGIEIGEMDAVFAEFLNGEPRYLKTAALLLEQDADINALDHDGAAPIHAAVEKGSLLMVKLLLVHGANPGIRRRERYGGSFTPMDTAIEYYHTSVARLLHQHGAKPDFEGKFPLHHAAANGQVDLLLWLLEVGGDLNQGGGEGCTPLMNAATCGHESVVRALCDRGADLQQLTADGGTLLHAAAASHLCLEPLLQRGLAVNVRDRAGLTPLHLAARALNPDAIKLLAGAGAEVNAQDLAGDTPLHAILTSGTELRPDIEYSTFQALIAAGSRRGIPNATGRTPYDLARENGYPGEYLELLDPGKE